MIVHLDVNDERYPDAAREILRWHDRNEAEANITSAIRDFLILTNLAKSDEIVEEKSPALGARTAVDLTALDTFVEVKRRIGTTGGLDPDPTNIEQLDGYLEESEKENGRHRMGVLTDGKHWLLRWPGAFVCHGVLRGLNCLGDLSAGILALRDTDRPVLSTGTRTIHRMTK